MLWFDGWADAPELHQRCVESWELYNLGWEVRRICRADLPSLLGDFLPTYERLRIAMNPLEKYGHFWIPPASESDLLRLALLGLYGGVWVDSTMLCRRPLDDWLPDAARSGFFAFAPEDIGEQIPVMSSFLASVPQHQLVLTWLSRTVKHWATPYERRLDLGFFWLHKLFGLMVGDPLVAGQQGEAFPIDQEARRLWSHVPKISGEYGFKGPHFWVKYNEKLRVPPSQAALRFIEEDIETPMWKLTNHEVKLWEVGPESTYWVLLETTRRQAQMRSIPPILNEAQQLALLKQLLAPGNAVGCRS